MLSIILCKSCGTKLDKYMIRESLLKNAGGVFMIRGECMNCDSWVKWMPYADSRLVAGLIKDEYERIQKYDTK